jgi:hypothetical protein
MINHKNPIYYLIILAFLFSAMDLSSQTILRKGVFGMAGAPVSQGSTHLNGTAGQSVIGLNSNASYTHGAGFWGVVYLYLPVEQVPELTLPEQFRLYQNYPNPFNPGTHIDYDLPQASNVTIGVYNLLGQRVAVLVNGEKPAGSHSVEFNSSHTGELASGIYIYRIETDEFVDVKKLILMK